MSKFIFITPTFICVLLMAGSSCKETSEQTTETTQSTEQQQPPATSGHVQLGDNLSSTTPAATSSSGLGSIQIEAMRDLWENCDGLDIIFYETNFSLSQTEKAAIQNTLGYFGPMQVVHNPDCKPVGRITFLVKGDIRQEADIYIAEGCQYFIWFKDNKPAYINPMSPQGVNFFEQIMKKGKNTFQ